MRRVVFHYGVRRAYPLSYGNYLDACGYSGTEGVIVETARILADAGHSVVVAGCSDAPAEGRVTYRDDLAAVDPATVDVLVPSVDAVASPARQLETCDYFVYPLCLPTGQVHHDTYGCCVHEALACGAIVITWDVAFLRDVFGENLVLLPPPRKWGYDPRAPLGWNRKMRTSPRVVQTFADAVRWWDGHPDLKDRLRRRAREWAVERTYDDADLRHAVLDLFAP